jgi:hypothetical protein
MRGREARVYIIWQIRTYLNSFVKFMIINEIPPYLKRDCAATKDGNISLMVVLAVQTYRNWKDNRIV